MADTPAKPAKPLRLPTFSATSEMGKECVQTILDAQKLIEKKIEAICEAGTPQLWALLFPNAQAVMEALNSSGDDKQFFIPEHRYDRFMKTFNKWYQDKLLDMLVKKEIRTYYICC